MVVTSARPASEAGREILARGGNAIDAAVAAAFAVGVVEPYHSGIGGGGFILFYDAESRRTFAIDARETAPAAAHRDMYRDASGRIDRQASRIGGQAVAVPGLVRGLLEVHERFGKLERAAVLEPAIRIAREGFPIGVRHRQILKFLVQYRRLAEFPETAQIQLDQGRLPPLGWRLVQEDLARTHEAIAAGGTEAFYSGPIAEAMVQAARDAGGALTLEDLASYRTRWREPVRGAYRGIEVVSMPPPSSGGVHLIQMLNMLEPFELAALGANSSESIHLVAESMKLAFADRAIHLGDPDFYPVPAEWLVSKAYGRELSQLLAPRPFYQRPPWTWGRRRVLRVERAGTPPPDDSGTSHLSIMDASGNAVAITQTVNLLFGSGLTVPEWGIVLNNEMDDFSAGPGVPNAFGLVGQEANAIVPAKRPLSSMTPTILFRDGKPWMVIGSPGGPRIITTVLQAVLNVVDYGMNIEEAVAAPRFHHQWKPDRLSLEPDHPRDVASALARWGHPVDVSDRRWSSAQGILRDPETGIFWGGTDPRSDGLAAGY
ncbi:MAG: gamma-glutamyltransferase [Myxococcota bacterium]|nr:gamma-glutamyltransferase [Myxococcota bacterium]